MATTKLEIQVGGMHCAACARTIEKVLGRTPGVTAATINFAAESCTVELDPSVVSREDIFEAIRELGYMPIEGDLEKKKS